jgi:hypothetical protein
MFEKKHEFVVSKHSPEKEYYTLTTMFRYFFCKTLIKTIVYKCINLMFSLAWNAVYLADMYKNMSLLITAKVKAISTKRQSKITTLCLKRNFQAKCRFKNLLYILRQWLSCSLWTKVDRRSPEWKIKYQLGSIRSYFATEKLG